MHTITAPNGLLIMTTDEARANTARTLCAEIEADMVEIEALPHGGKALFFCPPGTDAATQELASKQKSIITERIRQAYAKLSACDDI